jgi:hypothetical protein
LDALIERGEQLGMSIQVECCPADFMAQARQRFDKDKGQRSTQVSA